MTKKGNVSRSLRPRSYGDIAGDEDDDNTEKNFRASSTGATPLQINGAGDRSRKRGKRYAVGKLMKSFQRGNKNSGTTATAAAAAASADLGESFNGSFDFGATSIPPVSSSGDLSGMSAGDGRPRRRYSGFGLTKKVSKNFGRTLNNTYSLPVDFSGESDTPHDPINTGSLAARPRTSMVRRQNLDVLGLTMGLDSTSAAFLDWLTKAKGRDWLRSLAKRDPRACIKGFFDDVAKDGADNIEEPEGFHPELLSPLVAMFQRSSVFSVWRPTSFDSIHKMMTGQGTGKGLDIKGKSAKKGKLSAFVPFLQIHDENHKKKIRTLPKDGRLRLFYKKQGPRDKAYQILSGVLENMVQKVADAQLGLIESRGRKNGLDESVDDANDEDIIGISVFQKRENMSEEDQARISLINEWEMQDPYIAFIDDYAPKCFGLEMPKRLFWEGYVMRQDISREPGSEFDTGRPSRASFQDMNFSSIKNKPKKDAPRAVVWQYTDPYVPANEPDPDPMLPQTLLIAYEEHGRVLPVVSDFDGFLLGTRGLRFRNQLPKEQVAILTEMVNDTEKILKASSEGKCNNWTSSWLENMKHKTVHHPMPPYGYGDPKSYAIMKHAVHRLEEFGAVRHGAECFNYYFPQELDDEFLVIGGNLDGKLYKYMKLHELQEFLLDTIDQGFTFPLNPKWVLCDKGWKPIWDKLMESTHPNVQLSIDAWYPQDSGLRERIEEIHQKYPEGFQSDDSVRKKKGTGAWDEAEMALERYHRIQRAKRKLWAVLVWISVVQESQKKVMSRRNAEKRNEDEQLSEDGMFVKGTPTDEVVKVAQCVMDESVNHTERGRGLEVSAGISNDADEGKTLINGNDGLSSNGSSVNGSSVKFEEEESFTSPMTAVDRGTKTRKRFLNMLARTSDIHTDDESESEVLTHLSRMDSSQSNLSAFDYGTGSELFDQGIDVIDSLLNANDSPKLSEYQTSGLRQIRELLSNKAIQSRRNNRINRRHTSWDGRMSEDIPLFIAKEFGGAQTHNLEKFRVNVKKLIAAQRLMAAVKGINDNNSRECVDNSTNNYLPPEWSKLTKKKKQILAQELSFSNLARWDFNILEMSRNTSGSPLLFIGWAVLGSPHAQQAMSADIGKEDEVKMTGYDFVSEFGLKIPTLCAWLKIIESEYLPNPYHNSTHAADVVQTLNAMLQLGGINFAQSPLEIFSILVAAVVHDVKHPGLNNNFQVNSRSKLAVQYNDVSVLENQSVAWFFSTIIGPKRNESIDIFSGLSSDQFLKVRTLIIKSILETDMTHHFQLLKTISTHNTRLKKKGAKEWLIPYVSEGVSNEPSTDMLCFLLHQADISNPAKPHPLFVHWADCVMKEFYDQGDKELSMSLPVTPLCDRKSTDKKQAQIGFIKFVVQPSCALLGQIVPKFSDVVIPCLEKNLMFWEDYVDTD